MKSILILTLFCALGPLVISVADALDGQHEGVVGASVAISNKAGAAVKKSTGNVGEIFMDNYYTLQGWEKLPSQVGVNGIDGLYVRRDANGVIRRVLISESKTGTSILGETKHGTQMSHEWVREKVTNIDKTQLLSEKDASALKRLVETPDSYRRRLFYLEVVEGELKIVIQDVTEQAGKVGTKTIDGRGQVEQGSDYRLAKEVRKISLRKTPPIGTDDLQIYNLYFESLEREISPYMDSMAARKTIETLKEKYRNGSISNTKEQYRFLQSELIDYIKKLEESGSQVAKYKAKLIRARLAYGKLSARIPSNLRVAANAAVMAGLFSAVGHSWKVYQGEEGPGEAAKAIGTDAGLAGASMFFSDAIIQQVDGKIVISAATKEVLGIGVATFVFDATHHVYAFASGNITDEQFLEETGKSVVKALASGTAAYGAVLLGMTPGGPVIMAVSIGAYIVTDMAFTKFEEINNRNFVSLRNVLWDLPLDIQRRKTVLEIQKLTGETILAPTTLSKSKSILDDKPLMKHSTVLNLEPTGAHGTVLGR